MLGTPGTTARQRTKAKPRAQCIGLPPLPESGPHPAILSVPHAPRPYGRRITLAPTRPTLPAPNGQIRAPARYWALTSRRNVSTVLPPDRSAISPLIKKRPSFFFISL